MITFLVTPVKSREDALVFETPTRRLTFDVAETPILFDSLHQLKQLQSARRKSLCVLESAVKRPRPLQPFSPRRKSLCSLETPRYNALHGLPTPTPYRSSRQRQRAAQQPLSPLLDCENPFDAMEFLHSETEGLTPANLFNATINNLFDEQQCLMDEKEIENDTNDIFALTQHNHQFCITMLISNGSPPQQKIHQYLMENNSNVNPRGINLIESCNCLPCQRRNWNVVDFRWEKQWQIQQFEFIFDVPHVHNEQDGIGCTWNTQQICETQCEYITDILLSNGIIQFEQYTDAQKTFDRKRMKKTIQSAKRDRKKKTCLSKAKTMIPNHANDNKTNDKKFILQHLATWSSCTQVTHHLELAAAAYNTSDPHCEGCGMDVEYLPIVCKEDGCLFIAHETLRGLMDGSVKPRGFDYFVIIDCRYEYEYLGGHISGAVNVSDKLLTELLFKANMNIKDIKSQRIAWIFHCEYSKHRGPQTCKYFRKLDREMNEHRYPYVSYPHVYVLQGGYKRFWNTYKSSYWTLKDHLFEPYGYMSMWNDLFDDKRFIYSQFRKNVWKKTSKKHKTKLCHNRKS